MITTTLNAIRAHDPCKGGWTKLLTHLGKTRADDEPLAFSTILDSNGLNDAIWCCRAAPQYNKEWRLFAVWCARQVQHLITDPRSLAALDVAEQYADVLATDAEFAAAEIAADAATDAATDAAWAARDAAWDARDAAWAARDAAWDARDAAWPARAAAWAARDAAWAAVGAAEGDAAWAAREAADAARAAAGGAARAAAGDAARAAAGDAARDAARAAQAAQFRRIVEEKNDDHYDS